MGVISGDVVATVIPNLPAQVEAHFGIPACGAVINTINTRLEEQTISYMNSKRYLAGNATFETISLTLHDPIAPSGAQQCMEWVRTHFESVSGRAGYADGMLVDDEEEEYIRSGAGQSRRQQQTFLNMGGGAGQAQAEQMLMMEYVKYKNKGGDLSFEQFVKAVMQAQQEPEGAGMEQPQPVMMAANGGPVPDSTVPGYTTPAGYNKFDYRSGGVPVRVGAQEGGIIEAEASEMIDMGGMEKDYRNEGGFVAMGGKERADDVPARLSKNEFVFTADAVRNAGGGDIDKGAEVMENLMSNLEQGGEISEDSQGLEGAQAMYDQQQMLQSRVI